MSPELQTKFEGEARQFNHHTRRLAAYLTAVSDPIRTKDLEAFRFLMETIVVMMIAFLDHYLTNVVSTAAFTREADVRRYLAKKGNELEQPRALVCSVAELRGMMVGRASLLKKDGRRLNATFQFLFGFSVWPEDESAAKLVRDLARVRNIIVHAGGFPTERHFREMETPGFVEETSAQLKFYRMNLASAAPLVKDALAAASMLVIRLQQRFVADEKWHYRKFLEQLPPSVSDDEF